ncbi:hypothetical protein BSL78_16982 [Apostichopus japonicus]|uniref:DNA-directed DNA polymerase n=1 Tax=Stichopus japonicus TaxID=307972 RepID=A0A2G8KDT5_STIJA|nr:hypothetical protein BSL78_16982 [Apostichopus japonicus]
MGPYWVDGFATEGNVIFEFQGCWWHGCPTCYDEDTIHPYHQITMGELYNRTVKRKQFFRDVYPGHVYVEMWGHQWNQLKLDLSLDMKMCIAQVPRNLEPLNPREAFFGGRTNGVKLLHEVQGGEQIKYVDFCSLYPYVNKCCSYPMYHPKVVTDDLSHDMSQYYGLVRFKQEASGWPSWCITADDRDKYIADYAANEGIELDSSKINYNPGLRALAKLMLNSFWGKFGQRSDLEKTEVVTNVSRLYELIQDSDKTDVRNIRLINEEILEVCYKEYQEFAQPNARVNVVIAAFTTCHARLRLYDVLDRLQERVLYFDTDSIIYVTKPGEWEPPTGDYLGDLTNEIDPKDGQFIASFCTGGPKNYAYTLDSGMSVCKVRGITLNYEKLKK